eukprot:Gb_26595 [translate_table: standard]
MVSHGSSVKSHVEMCSARVSSGEAILLHCDDSFLLPLTLPRFCSFVIHKWPASCKEEVNLTCGLKIHLWGIAWLHRQLQVTRCKWASPRRPFCSFNWFPLGDLLHEAFSVCGVLQTLLSLSSMLRASSPLWQRPVIREKFLSWQSCLGSTLYNDSSRPSLAPLPYGKVPYYGPTFILVGLFWKGWSFNTGLLLGNQARQEDDNRGSTHGFDNPFTDNNIGRDTPPRRKRREGRSPRDFNLGLNQGRSQENTLDRNMDNPMQLLWRECQSLKAPCKATLTF